MKKIIAMLMLTAVSVLSQPIPVPPGGTPPPVTTAGDKTITPRNLSNLSEADLNAVYGPGEINLKEATINELLTLYAETVNRIILRPSTLPAPTITIRNQIPLTKREVIQMLDTVLNINGIAIINVGDKFAKAMPQAEAPQAGQEISKGGASSLPPWGQYQTHVVQLKYVKPSAMVPIIQPFAKIPNSILPVEENGILVIRDFAENVKRMLEMIELVDVSVPAEYISEVIPIKYALSGEIAAALNSLSGTSGGTSVGGSTGGTSSRSSSRSSFGGGLGGLGRNNMTSQAPGINNTGATGQPAQSGSFTDRLRSIVNRASAPTASGDITVIGETKIIADERTNSLLVYATREDMKTIKDVISKLDVVLAQVLIESIILGVSADTQLELGVSAAQKPMNLGGNVQGAGIMNNDKGSLVDGLAGLFATNAAANLGGLNYFGKVNDDWLVAVKALSSDGKTEVLQRPVIMTTHATPGHFFVGNTVPYVTSSYYGGSSLYGPSSSYQPLSVGIDLEVTPFINPDGIVVMKIDQKIEELDGTTRIEGVGDVPNTASRTLSADVTVRDRDTIVLGGFIRSSGTKTKAGVPLLKDVPVLGFFFRSSSDSKARRELLVLMRPTVLKTPELAAMGSTIERERMSGVNRFENRLEKDNAEFDKRMDALDDVKPMPKNKQEDPESKRLRDAIRSAPENEATPTPAPAVEPSTAPTTNDVSSASATGSTTLAATVEADWAQPAPKSTGAPASAKKPAKAKPADPFGSVQPMTEEEIKAFGRN